MSKVLTFFVCLWVTMILFFGFEPNFGRALAAGNSAYGAANAAYKSLRALRHTECSDGPGPNGYELCINNEGI